MRIAVLGPLSAHTADGEPIDIGGIRLRMLLARLALEGGRAVSVDGLIDGLWGAEPPADAAGALQALVSRLRKALPETGAVELVAGGYRLRVRADDVDAFRFEELLGRGRRELAAGKPEAAADTLGAALELWRGPALADLLTAPFAELAASRLDELRAARCRRGRTLRRAVAGRAVPARPGWPSRRWRGIGRPSADGCGSYRWPVRAMPIR